MKRILSNLMLILLMLTLMTACQKDEIAIVAPADTIEVRTLTFDVETLQLIHDNLLTEVNALIDQGVLNSPNGNGLIPQLNNLQRAIDNAKETGEEPIKANQKLEEDILPHLAGLLDDGVLTQELYNDLYNVATNTPLDEGTVSLGGVDYHWKIFNNQKWLVENLRYPIDEGTSSWFYPGTDEDDLYGMLYTQEAAIDVCPLLGEGWRLPTDAEWHALGTTYGQWGGASNLFNPQAFQNLLDPMYGENYGSSGFNAVLGGFRVVFPWGTEFQSLGQKGYYWSDLIDPSNVYGTTFYFYSDNWSTYFSYYWTGKTEGQSCRCVCNVEVE